MHLIFLDKYRHVPSTWIKCHLDFAYSWWRHHMKTFSALLAICAGNSLVTGEFLAQRPVTRSFDVFFDLHLNKPLSKQWWGWWFETLSRPLWRHCNVLSQHNAIWHSSSTNIKTLSSLTKMLFSIYILTLSPTTNIHIFLNQHAEAIFFKQHLRTYRLSPSTIILTQSSYILDITIFNQHVGPSSTNLFTPTSSTNTTFNKQRHYLPQPTHRLCLQMTCWYHQPKCWHHFLQPTCWHYIPQSTYTTISP